MTMFMSADIITRELYFLTTVILSVVCYMAVVLYFFSKENKKNNIREQNSSERQPPEQYWHDQNPILRRYPLSAIYPYGSIFHLSAFTAECLLYRTIPFATTQSSPKLCVSRSSLDTEKIIHPLIKKIESRLRRAEIRPRPRLRVERFVLPFPLYSATRADQELTHFVVEFLDASIELSIACNTQVQFALECQADGVKISAIWIKNQLITDATSEIDLLTDMRLTFHGDSIRWEYQLLFCPVMSEDTRSSDEAELSQTG